MSVSDAVCVAWIPIVVIAGVWIAVRPVGKPFTSPRHQAARACRFVSHEARHVYARLVVRRQFRMR